MENVKLLACFVAATLTVVVAVLAQLKEEGMLENQANRKAIDPIK